MRLPIYLDNNATTPMDPRVTEAMLPTLEGTFGNAASRSHVFGRAALEAVDQARDHVAGLIGCRAGEIVFTSGATESDNLALFGAARAEPRRRHIVSTLYEHPAILDPLRCLEKSDPSGPFDVTLLRPDKYGHVTVEQVEEALRDDTFLVSIMAANNEVGTVAPLESIGALLASRDVLFHTDAAQAVGKIPMDVEAMKIDLLSLTAHKFYGPKGSGALYVRKACRKKLHAQMLGGGHEGGLRSGTLAVPGVVGLGAACRLAVLEGQQDRDHSRELALRLREGLEKKIPGIVFNGDTGCGLPGTVHVSVPGLESQALMMSVPEVALSSGAACSSSSVKASHVLEAMGVSTDLAVGSLRFGIGRFNTHDDITYVLEKLPAEIQRLRRRR